MPFQPGQSGNPRGRRRGQPNRLTSAVRTRIERGIDPIDFLQRCVAGEAMPLAHGDPQTPPLYVRVRAASILADKLIPNAKDQPVAFTLPLLTRPGAILETMGEVAEQMARGKLTPAEASAVMNVIGQYAKAYEMTELERRVADLEASRNEDETQ